MPDSVAFGSVRKGESRKRQISIKAAGHGRANGRVVSQPGWLSVSPQSFTRRTQSLSVTGDTATIWETGRYSDQLKLDVDGEAVSIPVEMEVLPARRRFLQVCWWYIPLLVCCCLPMITAAIEIPANHRGVGAPELIAASLLSVMLLIICFVADLGVAEKLLPAVIAALGIGGTAGTAHGDIFNPRMWVVGVVLSLLLVFQFFSASWWRVWAAILIVSSVCATFFLAS
jgi:hypothetical protein